MIRGLESLSASRYPGRGIILGRAARGGQGIVIYFITGRSASSQARKLVWEGQTLWTRPTDEEALKKGQADLLIYPAVIVGPTGVAVSNGKQTSDLSAALGQKTSPERALTEALKSWSFEPDPPIYTPRISACRLSDGRAAFHIVRRLADGSESRMVFRVDDPGRGRGLLLTTYAGKDRRVCPSFEGRPRPVRLTRSRTAAEAVEAVYGAMEPPRGKRDFRVAAACLFIEPGTGRVGEISVINRQEREAQDNGQR